GGADLEVALGLGQLLRDGGLLRADQRQRVLRRQHLEVGLRGAQRQVLARLGEDRLRLAYLVLGLVALREVLRPEQRLRERQRVARVQRILVDIRDHRLVARLDLEALLGGIGREVERGQDERASLGDALAPGLEGEARGRIHRVVALRVPVHLQQVFRRGWRRERRGNGDDASTTAQQDR